MPIETKLEGKKLVVVRATGTLVEDDYKGFVPRFKAAAGPDGQLRVLFDMRGLQGWTPAAFWEEIKFDSGQLGKVDRLAVIGSSAWQHALSTAANLFADPETKYFEEHQEAEARAWLERD